MNMLSDMKKKKHIYLVSKYLSTAVSNYWGERVILTEDQQMTT